jgi:hypothetical protein
MLDIDPGLDTRLRAFFDQIEGTEIPSRLAVFEPATNPKGRRAVNLFAGAAGVAAIAVGVAVFAIDLNSHHVGGSPRQSGQSVATSTPGPSLPVLPLLGESPPLPATSKVLIPVIEIQGAVTLPTFTPTEPFYIETSCIGTGAFNLQSADGSINVMQYGCGSGGGTEVISGGKKQVLGKPLSLHVDAPSMTWEILIVESDTPTDSPNFFADPFLVPTGAHVLLPPTTGIGSFALPAFTPVSSYYIVSACSGAGVVNIVSPSGAIIAGEGTCGGLRSAGKILRDNQVSGQPQSLSIQAQPSTTWKILVYEIGGGS